MVWYQCDECGLRWRGQGRPPGGEVRCPRCGTLVYTYRPAKRPMKEE